jgi:hypothetical protein
VRERLRYVAHGAFEPAVEFVQPSPYVPWPEPRLQALRGWAAQSLLPGRPVPSTFRHSSAHSEMHGMNGEVNGVAGNPPAVPRVISVDS